MHIVFTGGWVGLVVGMCILGLSAAFGSDPGFALTCYEVMRRFGVAIPIFALGSIFTGLVLSAVTPWGLVRYWWTITKAVLALATIVTAVMLGGSWREQAIVLLEAHFPAAPGSSAAWLLVGSSVAHLLMLAAATVISVDKPWGTTPRGRVRRTTARRS